MKNSYTPEVHRFVNAHQQVTPNYTNEYSLVSPDEVHDLPVGSYGSPALTQLFFCFINRKHVIKIWRPSATPFLFICMCSIFSHFWTNLNLSSGKMDVIQVLAARVASVNSLFHIWVFSFSCWCWENLMSFGYSPPPPSPISRTDPAWAALCLCSGRTSFCSSSSSAPECSCGTLPQPQTCQSPPLETRPCCDFKSPSRRSWVVFFFFSYPPAPTTTLQDSRDCESLMKRKKFCAKRKKCKHPLFSASKSRACGFRCVCVFFFFVLFCFLMSFD